MSILQLGEYFAGRKRRVDDALDARLPASEAEPVQVHEAIRYAVLNGGKRIRPVVALAVADVAEQSPEPLLDAACALELAHTASLIFDDLPCMDDAQTRRGQPCAHVRFGKDVAVLAGIALLAQAFEITAANANALHRPEAAGPAVQLLARALGTRGLVGGQYLDLRYTHQPLSLAQTEEVHHRKAGALFVAAVQIPAVLLGLGEREQAALEQFARNTGLAFQITDDLLDEADLTEDAGKTTFTTHLGRNGARARVEALVQEAIDALSPLGQRAEPLRRLAEYVQRRRN